MKVPGSGPQRLQTNVQRAKQEAVFPAESVFLRARPLLELQPFFKGHYLAPMTISNS